MSDQEVGAFVLRVMAATAMWPHDLCDAIWWRCDTQFAPVSFLVGCNDLFFWGCADLEELTPSNIDVFEKAIEDVRAASGSCCYGPELFCARVRKMRPQGRAYPGDRKLWPLFDACGPERTVGPSDPANTPRESL